MTANDAAAIARLDGHGQAELVRTGDVPADALVDAAALRIAAIDPALNATRHHRFEQARAAARAVDRGAAMAAVPYLVKASLEYPGLPAEAGSLARRGAMAGRRFPFVEALDGAGLVPLGIATMPEFGLNATGESALYGPTRNPWDATRSAGGSSTGSAAAVAAGLVPFATASDAGGSIRLPASCCGIVGFKPSRGWNLRARAWNIVDDLLCSDGLYGRSMRDTIWAARMLRPAGRTAARARPANGLRIAVDLAGLDGRPPAADVARVVERAAMLCADLGHHVEARAQPFDRAALREGFTTLWAYSGGEIADRYRETGGLEAWTLGLERRRASIGPEALAAAFAQIDRAATALARFHETTDVVLSPVTATVSPALGHLAPEQDADRLWDALFDYVNYTPLQNMAGTPAISLPIFATEAGLPAGAMFAAGLGDDELLLALAAQIEAAAPWRDRWPPAAALTATA